MKFNARVITKSSKHKIVFKNGQIFIYVCSVPQKGKANKEVIKLLSKTLSISKSRIKLIKGAKNRDKIFEIIDWVGDLEKVIKNGATS